MGLSSNPKSTALSQVGCAWPWPQNHDVQHNQYHSSGLKHLSSALAFYESFMSSSSEPTAFSGPVTVVRPVILHRRNCLLERRPGHSLPAGARTVWATRLVPGLPTLLPRRQLQRHRPRPQNVASRAAALGCCGAALEDGLRNRRQIAFHGLTVSKAVQRKT